MIMAQPAPVQPRIHPSAPDAFGRVAAGGPIADLHRTLEERLIDCQAIPLVAVPHDRGGPHIVSRIAGPTLLVAAYAAVAIWWF
jgi:hypothetical protein